MQVNLPQSSVGIGICRRRKARSLRAIREGKETHDRSVKNLSGGKQKVGRGEERTGNPCRQDLGVSIHGRGSRGGESKKRGGRVLLQLMIGEPKRFVRSIPNCN